MPFCENCGAPYEGNQAFCENCGSPLPQQAPASAEPVWQPEAARPAQDPSYSAPSPGPSQQSYYNTPSQAQAPYQPGYQTGYQAQAFQQAVTPYASGGLIAWAVVTLLLCLIPGVIALVNAIGINKAATVEEQQKKISSTKTWCIIGTVLGVISLIASLWARNQ